MPTYPKRFTGLPAHTHLRAGNHLQTPLPEWGGDWQALPAAGSATTADQPLTCLQQCLRLKLDFDEMMDCFDMCGVPHKYG